MNNMKRYGQGLSLVEVMVSLVIGMIILAGIFSVYLSNSQSFRFNSQLARIQENGRFALSLLENDIRMAAYGGCAKMALDETDYDPEIEVDTATGLTKDQWIQGVEVSGNKLTIYGVPMEDGAIFLHHSCYAATKIDKTAGATEEPPPVKVDTVEYDSGSGVLTRKVGKGAAQTLIDNVESFTPILGVDNPGAGKLMNETISWANPTSAEDKKKVAAVRVELKLKSAEPVLLTQEATANSASDAYLHKTFRSTVVLRNKVPNGYGVCEGSKTSPGADDSSRCYDESP